MDGPGLDASPANRRNAVKAAVHRPYLYAGKGMGADVAAWKQAARAELAATMNKSVGYAVTLLGLVKAFERVPHHIFGYGAADSSGVAWKGGSR